MTIENQAELNKAEKPKIIEVHKYTTDFLRELPVPQRVQGGCRFMPQRSIITAEDPSYIWDINEVNGILQSLHSESISPSIEADLANMFGNIIMSLRRGERTVVEEEKPKMTRIEDLLYR